MHTGVKADTVGPGEYDIRREIANGKGVPTWHAPKLGKKSTLSTVANKSALAIVNGSADTPGPGYYQAEKTELFPIYKYKPSSVFASKVDRQGQRMRNSF